MLTGVNESSDHNSWKEFDPASANLSVTYDRTPNTPTGLSTSPATTCPASPPTTVGDADVTLYAPVSDPDGGNLTVTYQMWKTTTPGTLLDNSTLSYASGTTAVRVEPEATLKTAAAGAATQFSWKAQASDGTLTSNWSTTCSFTFDPTRPGQPGVNGTTSGLTIGQPATFTITAPPTGSAPARYVYQLNGAAPGTVTADSSGNTTITITPTRFTNVLTVNSVSTGGNTSLQAARKIFNAAAPTPQADQDLTGDNIPDLLTTGGQNGVPAGLWLARAQSGTGKVNPVAVNIGANGTGTTPNHQPSDFTGYQTITGHFTSASNGALQDLLTYNPATGAGAILAGNGDGSVLTPNSLNQWNLPAGSFSDTQFNDWTDGPGDNPRQLVNAGNTAARTASPPTTSYPDLIGINGDDTAGYYLAYYTHPSGYLAGYGPDKTTVATPDGTSWKNWTLATCQINGLTNMFLWNNSTGALYLWTNLTHTAGAHDLGHTSYTLKATGWNRNTALTLQAADLNGDNIPDLWAVGAGATATAYLVTNPSAGSITTQPSQNVTTANHTWLLNDTGSGTVGTAIDTIGAANLAGTGNVTWHSGDLYDPDLQLNIDTNNNNNPDANPTGALSTSGAAVTTNADFSVSAWVKPATTTANATVLSQNGTNGVSFALQGINNAWDFAMSTGDGTGTWDHATAAAGTVQVGVWTQLTATFTVATHRMNLYANSINIAVGTHTTTWNNNGGLQIGRFRTGASTYGQYFTGQIANVQTWNTAVDPTQAASPPGYYQPITATRFLDTRDGTGGTTGPINAGTTVRVQIAGAHGIPTSNVIAVAVNITVLATGPGA